MSVSTSNASSQRSSAPGSRDVSPVSTKSIPDELAREIAVEQAHVDRVHEELEKAGLRADVVQAEGLARSQFGRQVEIGDAEGAGLFERDALMFHAAKRRSALDTQYEGLVFGRLDIDHAMLRAAKATDVSGNGHARGASGTGKTVVALHRAAYLLYSDRRRFESGGILVVGPSGAYTAYIERVLPSLGEESVVLRALGDVVDVVGTERLDPPDVARIKGSTRIRGLLGAAARGRVPESPTEFRAMVAGHPVRLEARDLDRVRSQVLRQHQRNTATAAAQAALGEAAWSSLGITGDRDAKAEFLDKWEDHLDVESFMEAWWPQVDPREVLLWLGDPELVRRHARGSLRDDEIEALAASFRHALEVGSWSVADVALVDDLAARLGAVQEAPKEERGFYEIEELDDLSQYGVTEVQPVRSAARDEGAPVVRTEPRERLLAGRVGRPEEYAHVLVDEAQDLSPMQWRMIGRRGRYASWTVVGDAAQASWPDAAEAAAAREEAFGTQGRQSFHMDTNYRNAREIFDYAAEVVRREVPDADIPQAVRETGVHPVEAPLGADPLASVRAAVDALLDQVEGAIAVVTPARHAAALAPLAEPEGRVQVVDPMSTKGLEYDATVVVDPAEITRESPGGVRVLYVALTRAAHRMTVLS